MQAFAPAFIGPGAAVCVAIRYQPCYSAGAAFPRKRENGHDSAKEIRMRAWQTVALAAVILGIGIGAARAAEFRKEGPCKLQEAGAFDDAKHVKVAFGTGVVAKARFFIDEFFGKTIINAGATIENGTRKTVFFQYFVAFFDKDGLLVGCTGQGSFSDDGLAPGDESQLGSCLVHLAKEDARKVASYKAVLYVDTKPIGKE
jgi:hypothetical protein